MADEQEDLLPILNKLRQSCSIDFSQYREPTLRRRIQRRLSALKCLDFVSYAALLDSNPDECQQLMRSLTIKYTEFMRDEWVFEIIRHSVLPVLFANASADKPISIWSAGSATGEEPYTIAAIVSEMLLLDPAPVRVEVLGTDVDSAALSKARKGVYKKDQLQKPLNDTLSHCFTDDGESISARPSLRDLVKFEMHDLTAGTAKQDIEALHPALFDLIVCRNVLIYFKRPTQQNIQIMLFDLIAPGGFLVMGNGESISREVESRLIVVDRKARIYRKPLE